MKSQKGFGLIPILLILLLVTAVGFTGYYVYDKQASKKIDSSGSVAGDTSSKSLPAPTATPTTKATATPTPGNQKFLVIAEWGVKIPLSEELSDLKYVNNGSGLILNSSKLVSLSHGICNDPNIAFFGSIGRSTNGDQSYYGGTLKTSAAVVKIDNYYYWYTDSGENRCRSEYYSNLSDGDQREINEYYDSVYRLVQNNARGIQKI